MLDIYDIYDKMEKNNIMLSFKGTVTSELLTSILQIMESRLDNTDDSPKVACCLSSHFSQIPPAAFYQES